MNIEKFTNITYRIDNHYKDISLMAYMYRNTEEEKCLKVKCTINVWNLIHSKVCTLTPSHIHIRMCAGWHGIHSQCTQVFTHIYIHVLVTGMVFIFILNTLCYSHACSFGSKVLCNMNLI